MGIIHKLGKFNPLHIPDCVLWLEADRGVTVDGSTNVSAWADQSGSGYHFAQTDPAKRPAYSVSVVGGKPTVDFVATYSSLAHDGWAQTQYSTLIAVVQCEYTSDRVLLTRAPSTTYFFGFTGTRSPSMGGVTPGPSVSGFNVLALIKDGASSGKVVLNNGSPSNVSANFGYSQTWQYVGGNPGYDLSLGQGIAALVLYSRALTTAEIQRLSRAYGTKYGITVA